MDETIRKILEDFQRIAVVGMSRDPGKAAYRVPMYLRSQGYIIYPVNPYVQAIEDIRAYPDLESIPETVEIVEVFRPSDQATQVVKAAIRRAKERGDVRVVWLQEGIWSPEGRIAAEEAGLLYVEDRCMLVEHLRRYSQSS